MGKLKKAEAESDLGVEIKGSLQTGHQVEISRDDSIMRIFNTKHPEQANALLGHCMNVLARNEATRAQPRERGTGRCCTSPSRLDCAYRS